MALPSKLCLHLAQRRWKKCCGSLRSSGQACMPERASSGTRPPHVQGRGGRKKQSKRSSPRHHCPLGLAPHCRPSLPNSEHREITSNIKVMYVHINHTATSARRHSLHNTFSKHASFYKSLHKPHGISAKPGEVDDRENLRQDSSADGGVIDCCLELFETCLKTQISERAQAVDHTFAMLNRIRAGTGLVLLSLCLCQ